MLAGIVAVVSITILNDILYLDSQIDNLHLFFFFWFAASFQFSFIVLKKPRNLFLFFSTSKFSARITLGKFPKGTSFYNYDVLYSYHDCVPQYLNYHFPI